MRATSRWDARRVGWRRRVDADDDAARATTRATTRANGRCRVDGWREARRRVSERGDECATTTRAWTRCGVDGRSGDRVRVVVDVDDGVGERRDVDRRRRVLSGERVRRGDERVRAGDGERHGDV